MNKDRTKEIKKKKSFDKFSNCFANLLNFKIIKCSYFENPHQNIEYQNIKYCILKITFDI